MQIIEVSAKEYAGIFPTAPHVFNTTAFNELNRDKCDSLHFLVFRDSKSRLGLIAGEKDGVLRSPFSAPFGGFTTNSPQSASVYIEAVGTLKSGLTGKTLSITLPPAFYAPDTTAKTAYALEASGASSRTVLNYHVDLGCCDSAEALSRRDARRNLAIALSSGFTFTRLDMTRDNLSRVHRIISENRREKGYYLAMTEDEIAKTASIIPMDLFMVEKEGTDSAAALVYRVADGIAQVIYWGDTAGFRHMHPMALLTTELFNLYKKAGLAIVDAGPAGDFDALNTGLAAFKERIGCMASVKRQYIIKA